MGWALVFTHDVMCDPPFQNEMLLGKTHMSYKPKNHNIANNDRSNVIEVKKNCQRDFIIIK